MLAVLLLGCAVFAQQIQEESLVVNIEVPVRVFKGNTFVDNLTIDDFEVFENGIPQKIEAVYLIRKRTVERSEEKKRFSPQTSRDFYLFFEISEYSAKIGEAIEYFIQNVIVPGDSLTVITPLKSYRMKSKTFEVMPKSEVVKQLKTIVRRDALTGNSEYRATLDEVARMARALSAGINANPEESRAMASLTGGSSGLEFEDLGVDEQLNLYANHLYKLENLRKVDEEKLMDFARILKDRQGQKYVFMFYQREFIPQIEPRILNQYIDQFQDRPDIIQTILSLFEFYKREIGFNVDKVKQAYSDSSISIHFLFITKPPKHVFGIRFEEHSEDIYTAFKEMARATGGFAESSMNPDFLLRQAVEAAENYYLLYYSPKDYKPDGKFREIEVRVKKPGLRVSHRAGYFAN